MREAGGGAGRRGARAREGSVCGLRPLLECTLRVGGDTGFCNTAKIRKRVNIRKIVNGVPFRAGFGRISLA